MSIKDYIINAFSSLGFGLKNHASELLVAGGLMSVTAGFVVGIKEGYELDNVLDDHKERIDRIRASKVYTGEIEKKLVTKEYVKTGFKLAKHFGPALALEVAGATMIGVGFSKEHNEKLAAVAFGNTMSSLYNGYRKSVREELGEEFDNHFAYGTDLTIKPDKPIKSIEDIKNCPKEETFKEKESNGDDENMPSIFARFFDAANDNWRFEEQYGPTYREQNLMFIRSVMNQYQVILNTRGYVHLNEVYRSLGYDATTFAVGKGWVAKKYGGSGVIDFYLYDGKRNATRRFINGDEDECILLDFNIDGVITDKLDIIAKDKETMYTLWGDAIKRRNRKS